MNKQTMVREFMQAMNQDAPDGLNIPSATIRALRVSLIDEELFELLEASGLSHASETIPIDGEIVNVYTDNGDADIVQVADALADLLYVVYGAAVAWGINIDPVFGAVHQANMLKLTGPRRADGKQLKPEGWQPPDIRAVLDAQMA